MATIQLHPLSKHRLNGMPCLFLHCCSACEVESIIIECGRLNSKASESMQLIWHLDLSPTSFPRLTHSGTKYLIPLSPSDYQPDVILHLEREVISLLGPAGIPIRHCMYGLIHFLKFPFLLKIQNPVHMMLSTWFLPADPSTAQGDQRGDIGL